MADRSRSRKKMDRLVYGAYPVLEALESGQSIEKVFIQKEREAHAKIKDIKRISYERHIPFQMVPEIKLERLCGDVNHQGVVALIAPIAYQELEPILIQIQEAKKAALLLLLDGVTDVRNLGAIARTAECLGVDALVLPLQSSAPANADAIKTSAGALHYLPVCRVSHLVDAILLLQAYQVPTVACTEKATHSLYEADLQGPICLVLGSEDKGISSSVLKRTDSQVRIPMYGKVASLNVSVAAGICLSEVVRQRSFISG